MQQNKLESWLTIGTNISVLLGLILLIYELNQNNELVKIQLEQSRSDTFVAWQRDIALNDHVAPIFAKMKRGSINLSEMDIDTLNDVEYERFLALAVARFYDYETLFAQYQRGFVSDEYWDGRIVGPIKEWDKIWLKLFKYDVIAARRDFIEEIKRIRKSP